MKIEENLREHAYGRAGIVLDAGQCAELRGLYAGSGSFRTRIDMARYRFGKGEYQYFCYPLPAVVQQLRECFYAQLAPIAERWMADLRSPETYPPGLDLFLARSHAAGQTRPTPLMLRYVAGNYNCLHQDLYGAVVFPFQVVIGLSAPDQDYTGGELMLVEQQPRAQSKGTVIPLRQGEAVVITTRYRPAQGSRGFHRVNVKHGVSTVLSGERYTLGLIFHDAE